MKYIKPIRSKMLGTFGYVLKHDGCFYFLNNVHGLPVKNTPFEDIFSFNYYRPLNGDPRQDLKEVLKMNGIELCEQ